MKLYTRRGDDGETGLFGGGRVPKHDARVEAYGCVDELNAAVGVAESRLASPPVAAARGRTDESAGSRPGLSETGRAATTRTGGDTASRLGQISADLFAIGAWLATPPQPAGRPAPKLPPLPGGRVAHMEAWIDEAQTETGPLRHFVLPGGCPAASALHLARTVCRRAERRVVALASSSPVNEAIVPYLNRLSDYLFAAARLENKRAGRQESEWRTRP